MLRYLDRYLWNGRIPDEKSTRGSAGNWEIRAVVRGAACPVTKGTNAPEWFPRQLWIVSPQVAPVWKRDPSRPCEMIVARFAYLHPIMENFISRSGLTAVTLSSADMKKVDALYTRLLPHYRNANLVSSVVFEQGMLELCLLVLRNMKQPWQVPGSDANSAKVQQALTWHQEHMSEGMGVRDVAAALKVSPSHLRRLFQSILEDTPKHIFQRSALAKACRLMTETSSSLKEIAYLCGYKGFNQFHRAFRSQYQQAPEEWRRNAASKVPASPSRGSEPQVGPKKHKRDFTPLHDS